ncbi:MAG TPA: ThuA domain-containing protein, partial [Opitutaceae bacterium]|nr:ThuA domain-containing protein [Opitutaceae bacterium]
RDHYFSRIWRVQHKEAKKLEVPALDRKNLAALIRTIETSPNAHVKKTALRLAQESFPNDARVTSLAPKMGSSVLARYESARGAANSEQRAAVLSAYFDAKDDWTRAAMIAAATEHAAEYVELVLPAKPDAGNHRFLAALGAVVPSEVVPNLVQKVAAAPSELGASLLRGISHGGVALPAPDSATLAAFQKLLANSATAAVALPLAIKFDRDGTLAAKISTAAAGLLASLSDPSVAAERRADIAAALVTQPQYRSEALQRIGTLLADPAGNDTTRAPLIAAVGELAGREPAGVLIAAYVQTKSSAIFEQLLKRPDSALALLAALKEGRVTPVALGTGNLARLRTHPNNRVSAEAAAVLGTANAPTKEKDAAIAKLLPEIEKAGDATKGRTLFTAACAACHKLGDLGTRDVGPPLAGMGAHPNAELLQHIVDPNRQVEPSFWQWNVTSKKGESFTGVIARETAGALTLRNQSGDFDLKVEDIATRENTRRSLMPEGFENIGAEGLRDLIAFLRASAGTVAAVGASAPAAVTVPNPKAGGRGDAPLPPVEPAKWEAGKTRVLLIAGGSSHNFGKFFGESDTATLKAAGFTVHYTEDRDQATELLPQADVAVVSVNRKFFDTPEYRKALFAFAAAGKGLVMLHPGTWYGYAEWPELNAKIVGGGARGHDRLGKYAVNAVKPGHPVMKGVPASFEVEDELYYINAEPDKIAPDTAPIEVLAETSPSVKFSKPHPAVWTTQHDKARIVGITLGHDQRVHDMDAYKALLTNAVTWVGRK